MAWAEQPRSANDVILKGTCTVGAVRAQYESTRSKIHSFRLTEFKDFEDLPCTCKGDAKIAAKAILPLGVNTNKVLVYNNCYRTLLASSIRQGKSMPSWEPTLLKRYYAFCDKIFEKEIIPMLEQFKYSYDHWYNHLEKGKQDEIDLVDKDPSNPDLLKYVFNNFSKREIQAWLDGSDPKARNISAPNAEVKYVMGPVIWQLEYLFGEHFHGYCGSANYNDMAEYYKKCLNKGWSLIAQGDGSGFDLSQTHESKYIDRLVYDWLSDNQKITHVEPETFRSIANRRFRKLNIKTFCEGRVVRLGEIMLDATVGSGSPDTTFGNTLRMSMYNRFVLEEIVGLEKEDYGLKTKGDDFVALLPEHCRSIIQSAYYEFFVAPSEFKEETDDRLPIKSGQILKFLQLGDIESVDFCSTAVMYRSGTVTVLRKLDRLTPLAHWSVKALSYSQYDMYHYYVALRDSFKAWAGGLAYYGEYADVFDFYAKNIYERVSKLPQGLKRLEEAKKKVVVDRRRTIKTQEGPCRPSHREDHVYGRDFAFSLLEKQQTNNSVNDEDVYNYILEKYGYDRYTLNCHIQKLKYGMLFDELGNASILGSLEAVRPDA